ncbi:hypothetical protein M406DRAFT_295504 [Cryphonectria parasitica EP155]|uniref:F-box domain-containing protein n=1 Tax=Cryphonectria parasitica (strain ATCC 38755 / EP155) TaxID=660469 RepID=A0A9P4XV17_CRYP1|nr:uncharacterized protein M406DRAFT_295504 [Cryphonectria parasitica EP155]KAF3761799.1 hypothetical protein M406DRAFT_295504 [Cryphonectria parasitica EP155]
MLDTLPDDILYIVFSHLESANAIRALSLTSRRLRNTIQAKDEGWRIFVRSRFPSIPLPSLSSSSPYTWHHLADSLTWQDRAWARRSLTFQAMFPRPIPRQRTHRLRTPAPFHPVLDARLDFTTGEELVIWGAGEDLIARRRQGSSGGPSASSEGTVWHQIVGGDVGHRAGPDDFKTMSIIEDVTWGVVTGRYNGQLTLLSAGAGSFGESIADFHPRYLEERPAKWRQDTVNSVDILRRRNLMASTSKSGVFLYQLPGDPGATVAPSSYLDLAAEHGDASQVTVYQAKWMGEEEGVLALGLSGTAPALKYARLTPTGLADVTAVKTPLVEDTSNIKRYDSKLCHRSLTPVDASSIAGGRGANLLLSAWRDGMIRLQDIRTPSPLDSVFCDNIDPLSSPDALLPFGTTHFVAGYGGGSGTTVKIFDFRWPRQYHHTTALPCGPESPKPKPGQAFLAPPRDDPGTWALACDHVAGRTCRWHKLSRSLFYRPNANFLISKALPRSAAYSSIWSMARASPLSPNFYIGVGGGIVEASLAVAASSEKFSSGLEVDPHFGHSSAVSWGGGPGGGPDDVMGAQYRRHAVEASLMETGDGLYDERNESMIRFPPVRLRGGTGYEERRACDGMPDRLLRIHRLDPAYRLQADFFGRPFP